MMDIDRIHHFQQKDRVKTMSVKIYNKLIRDKIPQIIEQSGKKTIIEEVSGKEYLVY